MTAQPESIILNKTDMKIEEDDEEKKVISTDESLQKKSNIPLAPVTFHFVGIRPSKSHEKNKQTSTKLLGVYSTKIMFKNLSLNDNVGKLKELIIKQFEIPSNRSILIFYGNVNLIKDDEELKNYGITDNAYFVLAIYDNISTNHQDLYIQYDDEEEISRFEREENRRQRDLDAVKRRLQRIKDLKNGIKVDSANIKKRKLANDKKMEAKSLKDILNNLQIEMIKDVDIITLEKNVNCMKLPICGHGLSANSLYQYILSQCIDREQTLKCPHTKCDDDGNNTLCAQKWDYPLIKQYLLHSVESDDEKEEYAKYGKLELLSARNVIEMNYDLQRCPDCKTLLYRNGKDNNFVVRTECPLCPSTVFCWGCNDKWCDDHLCDTTFRAQTMEIISKCSLKTIGRVSKVPSIRACPKCHGLIHHISACKHIKCSFCKTSFCFICLKPKKDNKWQCGDYNDQCPVKKRQNQQLLPKLNQTVFTLF